MRHRNQCLKSRDRKLADERILYRSRHHIPLWYRHLKWHHTGASRNITVCLARGNAKILPVIFFLFGAIISAAGAGGLIVAVIMPIAPVRCS